MHCAVNKTSSKHCYRASKGHPAHPTDASGLSEERAKPDLQFVSQTTEIQQNVGFKKGTELNSALLCVCVRFEIEYSWCISVKHFDAILSVQHFCIF